MIEGLMIGVGIVFGVLAAAVLFALSFAMMVYIGYLVKGAQTGDHNGCC